MTEVRSPEISGNPLGRDVINAVRYYLGGRRGLAALVGIALVAGLAFNWGWLVAAGIAPLLLAMLPCAVMCALGLCMTRLTGRSCSRGAVSREDTASPATNAPEVETVSSPAAAGLDMSRHVSAVTDASVHRHPETTRKRSVNHA